MRAIALALALSTTTAACTPVAIAGIIAGGGVAAVSASSADKTCDGEGCAYTKVLASLGFLLGLGMMAGGGYAILSKQ